MYVTYEIEVMRGSPLDPVSLIQDVENLIIIVPPTDYSKLGAVCSVRVSGILEYGISKVRHG